jgi:DNA invertase Pin-like site-specific DNA recombinase
MVNLAGAVAGVYRRCSLDRNDEASVSEQEELGVARCEAEGWERRLYLDNDRSASRYAKKARDDWPRLLADLRAGQLAVVWLWESSRGDRKLYEWAGFLEDCRDRGVRIYVETHQRLYDPLIPRDWKTLAEDGVANAYASDETSQRVKRTLAANARKGIPNGKVPYGYRRLFDPRTGRYATQEPGPPESGIAAGIITRIARNEALYAIVQDLEGRKIPPPRGQAWCTATLRKMARNPAYAGRRRTPDGQLIEAWPAIVSLETHLAAVAVLASSARSAHRPGSQRHLLSYLATCAGCGGGTLSVVKNKYRQQRYQCREHGCVSVDPAWLDELVTILACGHLSRPGAAKLFRSDSEEAARRRGEAAVLRAQLDEWAAADVSARAYQVKEAKLLPQIERAERAAAAAELPLVLRELLGAENVRAGWDHLDIPARRAVIRALMTVSVAKAADRTRASRTEPGRVIIGWVRGQA